MLERNFVKEKLQRGEAVLGTWCTLAAPLVVEALANTGLDFVLLDFEHGPFQLGQVHEYVSRCERYRCSAIVRLPEMADWMVLQALDQGAHGVMLAHVEHRSKAEALIRAARYAPAGERSFTPYTRAGGFSNRGASEYPALANAFGLTAILVESWKGMAALDRLLDVPGLDLVYFGAYDLSQEAGLPGAIEHPKIMRVLAKGVAKAVRAGKWAGAIVTESRNDAKRLLEMGVRFIAYEVDAGLLSRQVRPMVEWFGRERKR